MEASKVFDPVVERVRQAREALAKSCDYDVAKMLDLFKAMQAEHPDRVRQPKAPVALKPRREGTDLQTIERGQPE